MSYLKEKITSKKVNIKENNWDMEDVLIYSFEDSILVSKEFITKYSLEIFELIVNWFLKRTIPEKSGLLYISLIICLALGLVCMVSKFF